MPKSKSDKLDEKIGEKCDKLVKKYKMKDHKELWEIVDLTCRYKSALVAEMLEKMTNA